MTNNKKCTILGGGTAGWLTAIAIRHEWPDIEIEVVEDPKRPPIIAGESGGHGLTTLYKTLGLDINAWAKETGATPKLGGSFIGWAGKGSAFYHALISPFCHLWQEKFGESESNRLLYLRALMSLDIPIHDMMLTGPIMRSNKVAYNKDLKNNIGYEILWHFDSRANADYLKRLGITKNIKLVEGEYINCDKDERGNITSLNLADGKKLQSDWYFDCSGFARLLLGKEYNVPVTDYSAFFPARSVIAWWDKPDYNSSTIATTMNAGWSWKIGLRHRTGQGYLYDPDFLTKDQALEEARNKFGQHIEPVAALTFSPCMFKKHQERNVFGIGLSTGFMEPLEANGVGMIVDAIAALKQTWTPDMTPDDPVLFKFNLIMEEVVENIKDFLLLHYRGKGLETEFWKGMQEPERIPDSIRERLDFWGRFYRTGEFDPTRYNAQFSPESWLTVIQGLKLFDPNIIELKDIAEHARTYYLKEKKYQKVRQDTCIGIEEWIKRF